MLPPTLVFQESFSLQEHICEFSLRFEFLKQDLSIGKNQHNAKSFCSLILDLRYTEFSHNIPHDEFASADIRFSSVLTR